MKKQITILLLMSILSLTACSKEPQESIGASEVIEDERQDSIIENEEQGKNNVENLEQPIYFGKEETEFLELGDKPVICQLDSKEKTVEAQIDVTETVVDNIGCIETDVHIKIDDVWFHPVEKEFSPKKVYLGNLKNGEKTDTFFFVEHSGDIGVYAWVNVYEYVDGKLEEVGSIPGWIDEDSVTKENNKEITSTSGIIDLIQQNCYEGKYEMKDGRLVEIEREFYNLVNYENQDITLLEELIVYECPDVESKQFTMQPQKVHLVRSDGVEWMEIVAEDGTKGYARADGFTMLDMDNRDSTEIFDGLAYAG